MLCSRAAADGQTRQCKFAAFTCNYHESALQLCVRRMYK
jgi:hypothetical protein